MLKKLLMLCLLFGLSVGAAFAAVEVNSADQATLESVKGLGPVKSKAIIDERSKNGPFKNADDLANRVKGLGAKSVSNLEQAGLTVGGSSAPPTGAKTSPRTASSTSTPRKPASTAATSPTAPSTTAPMSTPAPTTAPAPAADTAASSSTTTKKLSKRAQARADAASGASSTSSAKKPRGKKNKAASDAAAT